MRAMKDSGIEWIGKIPESWDTSKLLYSLRNPISDGPHETPEVLNSGIPFVSVDSLNDSEKVDFSIVKKFISEEQYLEYQRKANLEEGDILFSKAATIGKTAIVGSEKFMVWSPLAIIKPNPKKLFNKYLYYLLNCNALITDIILNGSYNTQVNVGMREIESARIPIVSIFEQIRIAEHLDNKCAEIDALIAAKEKTNSLLKERRKSIIYEAVTKGLNPDAPMKDSGIEWIGQIPQEWETRKIKYCFTVFAGATPKSGNSEYWDGDIVWVTPADYTSDQKYISNGKKSITQKGFESCSTEMIPAGSLVFSKRAPIGLVAINTVDLCTNQGCLSCVPIEDNDAEFFYYAFSCFTEQFDLYGSGTTFKEISADEFMNFAIPYPVPEMQRLISEYLRNKCAEMDELISANELTIQKLKEYRQSVIYEAVTGKIKI